MIYVENTAAPVTIRIPRSITTADPAGIDLDIIGTVSRAPRSIGVGNWQASQYYYTLDADFRHCTPGEYTYYLTDSDTGEPLASGILILGEIPAAAPVEYHETTYYEQYNA